MIFFPYNDAYTSNIIKHGYIILKLFLLEDDYLLNKTITQFLKNKGFDVVSSLNGMDALNHINDNYSLMILDIDTPELDGITILQEIRKLYPMRPIIMISATIDISMITEAYHSGCNDYLKKPFDIRELELKIEALTRLDNSTLILENGFTYNVHHQQLYWNETEIVLTPKERKLFHILIENKSTTVTFEHLENAIWDMDTSAIHLRQLVARLRKKLPENIIQNRPGSGYCIV